MVKRANKTGNKKSAPKKKVVEEEVESEEEVVVEKGKRTKSTKDKVVEEEPRKSTRQTRNSRRKDEAEEEIEEDKRKKNQSKKGNKSGNKKAESPSPAQSKKEQGSKSPAKGSTQRKGSAKEDKVAGASGTKTGKLPSASPEKASEPKKDEDQVQEQKVGSKLPPPSEEQEVEPIPEDKNEQPPVNDANKQKSAKSQSEQQESPQLSEHATYIKYIQDKYVPIEPVSEEERQYLRTCFAANRYMIQFADDDGQRRDQWNWGTNSYRISDIGYINLTKCGLKQLRLIGLLCPKLHALEIGDGIAIRQHGAVIICKYLKQLTSLYLWQGYIGDIGLIKISRNLPKLQIIVLENGNFTDRAIYSLISKTKQLKQFTTQFNVITIRGHDLITNRFPACSFFLNNNEIPTQ